MLTTLSIKNFAIVKQLELDFSKGMTAFTGETGAGKSIMIDALMLALGHRADASVIRPSEQYCDITAGFIFDTHSDTAHWLDEQSIPYEEDELYLRRIIYPEGRSKAYINGQPVALLKLKELGETLVHLHGQHQHQTLLKAPTHRQQLDQYAEHTHLLEEVASIYKHIQDLNQEIDALKLQTGLLDKRDLLQFQIEELSSLQLKEGEMEALNREHQRLHHAKDYIEQSETIRILLSGEDGPNISSVLNQILQLLAELPQENTRIKTSQELINSALIQCEETLSEISLFTNQLTLDPDRLKDIELRLSAIHNLARKYHVDSLKLPALRETFQQELESLMVSTERLKALETELQNQDEIYQTAALKLRASRQIHAKKLAQEISASIQQLGMPKGYVELELKPLDKAQSHGLDRVEYKVCTNPGMEPDYLNKIASGGELSRIGLSIQMITAKKGRTPTLIFDEVDVGIGGKTAALVGKLLRHLGERLQVFCVTHQPQVAASAHHHYQVAKISQHQETTTEMTLLNPNNKISEVARMLGGLTLTEQSLSHARALIKEGTEA